MWTGKVGLMYPSDYGYATSGGDKMDRATCTATQLYKWNINSSKTRDCANNSWLRDNESGQWPITPSASYNGSSAYIDSAGYVDALSSPALAAKVRPVIYLRADVKIIGGDGTKESPYQLGL